MYMHAPAAKHTRSMSMNTAAYIDIDTLKNTSVEGRRRKQGR
jgi:hypothetical protein